MEFSNSTRLEVLNSNDTLYDIIIIGGGISGAGTALAAAVKGLNVLLIDKSDFGSGTSSRSSKMIHGGLRYLQQMNFALVKESLTEREILLRNIPQQVYAQEYLYPVYEYSKNSKFEVKIGLIGYDLLAGSKKIEHHRMLQPEDMKKVEPEVCSDKLTGGFIYYDCLVDDARLTLTAIQSAVEHGAKAVNYAKVESIKEEKNETIILVKDKFTDETREFRTKIIVNATGPWTDAVRNYRGDIPPILRPTKGIHIVFKKERLPLSRSVVIFSEDGRMIFTVPKGDYTYIGTTDTDWDKKSDDIFASMDDINYLLKAANTAFDKADLKYEDIISTWAGLRPLIGSEGDPSDISRDFEIIEDSDRFLSIAGGKLTTFRIMGEKIVERVLKNHPDDFKNLNSDIDTKHLPLYGGNIMDINEYRAHFAKEFSKIWKIKESTIQRLISEYGTRFTLINQYGENNMIYIGKSDILRSEILYLIEHEMVMTLEDIMWRRLSLLLFDEQNGLHIVHEISEILANNLNWSVNRKIDELEKYTETVEKSHGIGLR